ncbi:glycosyltransferase [Bacillus sp. APMAM]|nr:glycosyltransferase [Bacillus sp. APMAM]RTZ55023.1 glycosyltransferase [Bacillus sp. SAJ1]
MKPYVSLCMIVKNEEKVLERCLSSVKDIIDEIIVVDTGSTDQTVEIASRYVSEVYHFEWNDSFADARNYAQSKANGEWILVMDADEYVDSSNLHDAIQELRSLKDNFNACEVRVYNFTGNYGESIVQNHSIRLFKNEPSIGYNRSVHEQVTNKDGDLMIKPIGLILYHSGYLNNVVGNKNKNERNTKLIEKEIKLSGQTGFDYFNLGNELFSQGAKEKALEAYVNAYQKKPEFHYSWVSFCVIQIINCLYELHRYQDALNVITDAEKIYSKSPDFKCFKAIIFVAQKRFDDAIIELEYLLDNKDNFTNIVTSVDFLEYRPHQMLGSIFKEKGDFEKAVFHLVKAINLNQFCYRSLLNLMEILIDKSTNEEIDSFLEQNGFVNNSKDTIKFARVFTILAESEMARKYINKLEEGSLIKKGYDLKLSLFEGNGDYLTSFFENETLEELNSIIKSGSIDINDLILFCFAYQNDNRISLLLSTLLSEEKEKQLLNYLVLDSTPTSEVVKEGFLLLLEKALQMRQYQLFKKLTLKAGIFKDIALQIGHILFRFKYQKEAMNYYEKVDPNVYDDKAFINIIEFYKNQNNYKLASEWIIVAISFGKTDYRFFEYALEFHLEAKETYSWDINQIANIAFQQYPGSQKLIYLNNQVQNNLFNSNTVPSYVVGFFIETTYHYYVYESIIDELVNSGVKCHLVLNDNLNTDMEYMFNDLVKFVENIERQDIEAYTLTTVKDNDFVYDCMVSCYYSKHLQGLAKKQVRAMYGLLAKEYWDFSWWNVFYDKILCYSEYDYSRLNINNNSVIVGAPKFDKWFRDEISNNSDIRNKFQLDNKKQTILYAPTYGHLSSIDEWIEEINALQDHFNVIIKLHNGTAFRESEEQRREIINQKFSNITSDPADLFPLFKISDFVITDTSGIIFDAMMADKNILLLNHSNTGMVTEEYCEKFIRDIIVNIDKDKNIVEYLFNDSLFEEQNHKVSKAIRDLYTLRDGLSGKRAAQEILNLLSNRKCEEIDILLLSLRKRIFEM